MRTALLALAAALFAIPALAQTPPSGPDPSMLQPVRRWIDAYNSGRGPLPEDIFTDDVVITDEFAPYVWTGRDGEHRWAAAIDSFMKPGRQHVSVSAPQSFRPSPDGSRVLFVLPAALTLPARNGGTRTEHALWLFVLVRAANSWKIAADIWTQDAGGATAVIPMRQERGVLFVQAMVNGKGPLLFTFDPGGKDIYTSYARAQLGRTAPRTICFSSACFPTAMGYVDGDPNALDPKHDPSGGIISGSIGPQLVRRFVVRIDYLASTLTLIPAKRFEPSPGAVALPLGFDSYGMPTVHAQVDGVPGDFEVDVRVARSMLFKPFAVRTGTALRSLHTVRLGTSELRGVTLSVSNATSGKFANPDVAGLFGNTLLSRFVLTLDVPHKRLYLTQ